MKTTTIGCCVGMIYLGLVLLSSCNAAPPADETPVLRVAYFVPSDQQPFPAYKERIDRVLRDIQNCYLNGMKQHGFGAMTFQTDHDSNGKLRIFLVNGQEPLNAYPIAAKDRVRNEVKTTLAESGIDMDHETVLVFQVGAMDFGPFLGGGTGHKESALVFDDPRLDPALLASTQPGGVYKSQPCSLGEMNSHAIGGIAHELGHAFGLAHDSERAVDRTRRGRSLMGSGSHDYGDERRRKGPGAYFTPASAAPLSLHPLFTRKKSEHVSLAYEIDGPIVVAARGKLTISGNISGGPLQAVGLVAFCDPRIKAGAYDAIGWPCEVKKDGTFQVVALDQVPGDYDLRLRIYCENGQFKEVSYQYTVDRFGRPDSSSLQPAD